MAAEISKRHSISHELKRKREDPKFKALFENWKRLKRKHMRPGEYVLQYIKGIEAINGLANRYMQMFSAEREKANFIPSLRELSRLYDFWKSYINFPYIGHPKSEITLKQFADTYVGMRNSLKKRDFLMKQK